MNEIMKKFEYKIEIIPRDIELKRELNDWGSIGWEAIQVENKFLKGSEPHEFVVEIILKREITTS
jgi:hypothetical protein